MSRTNNSKQRRDERYRQAWERADRYGHSSAVLRADDREEQTT